VSDILSKILPAIAAKEKNPNVRLQLIGLGAVDFIDRPSGDVRNFFAAKPNEPANVPSEEGDASASSASSVAEAANAGRESEIEASIAEEESDEAIARRLQTAYDNEKRALPSPQRDSLPVAVPAAKGEMVGSDNVTGKTLPEPIEDPDLLLAKRLQADYDRENRMVQALERREKMSVQRSPKTRKIESFFKRTSD
jgi:hypothetical protein